MWAEMNVVGNECGVKGMCGEMNVVGNECEFK